MVPVYFWEYIRRGVSMQKSSFSACFMWEFGRICVEEGLVFSPHGFNVHKTLCQIGIRRLIFVPTTFFLDFQSCIYVNCKIKLNYSYQHLIIQQNKSTQNMWSKSNLAKISLRKINPLKSVQYTISYRYSVFWISLRMNIILPVSALNYVYSLLF